MTVWGSISKDLRSTAVKERLAGLSTLLVRAELAPGFCSHCSC